MSSIYFICVNYNNSHYTKLFIESLSSEKEGRNISIVIVDNCSKEKDYEELSKICSCHTNVKLIRSERNLGYFGGLNLGLDDILPMPTDLVVVGNNDLTFDVDFVSKALKKKYPEDVLVVAPNVITADGYPQNPHCINRVSKFRKFLYDIYFLNFWCSRVLTFVSYKLKKLKGGRENKSSSDSQYIHMGIGACYLLTPSFFKNFSKLDGSVFLYGEEALLAGQVMSVGGKTFYDADLIVHHAESATLSKLPSKDTYNFAKKSYPYYKRFL